LRDRNQIEVVTRSTGMSYDFAPGRPGDQGSGRLRGDRSVAGERLITGEHAVADVGGFSQGSALSQELLRRYLLTRALGSSVRRAFQWVGIGLLVVAIAIGYAGLTVLAVLIGLLAIAILLVRALLSGVQRRLSGAAQLGAHTQQVEALVGQTRKGLRHELRRVGLPGTPWGPALIVLRLARRSRRGQTLVKLSQINLAAVVPQSRVDELHMLLARGR
jgi:hypothetical protein